MSAWSLSEKYSGKKEDQQVSVTICWGLTKSLNIQGEEFIIIDEITYFKTIRRAAVDSASNDKGRHSLFNKTMCCNQENGKTSEDTDKTRSFLSLSVLLDRFEFF